MIGMTGAVETGAAFVSEGGGQRLGHGRLIDRLGNGRCRWCGDGRDGNVGGLRLKRHSKGRPSKPNWRNKIG